MDLERSLAAVVFEATDITRPPNGSSQPTRDRRKKARQKAKKGGKAGNQGNFHGERLAFMDEHFPGYREVKGKGKRIMGNYWTALFPAYWAKFPWYLPLDKDPDQLPLFPAPEASEETTAEKGKVIKQTEARIKTHLGYRFTMIAVKEDNPWRPLLAALKMRAKSLPPPRRLSAWQLYMTKKSEDIAAIFDERWPHANLPAKRSLAFRSAISRELFAAEPEDFQAALEEETVRMHAEEMAEYEASNLPGAQGQDDDKIRRARNELATVVQPLLELLQEYSGLYCTLIAGVPLPPGPEEFFLKVVTSGRTAGPVPEPWHIFEKEAFGRDVMHSFARFLMKTPEYQQRMAGITTTGNGPGANVPLASAAAQLSELNLTIAPISSRAGSPQHAGKASSSKLSAKARGKRAAKRAHTGSEASAVESSDHTSSDETSNDESSEDSDEDEEEGEGEELDDAEEQDEEEGEDVDEEQRHRPRAPTPTLEELGFGDAMAAKLAAMGPKRRRSLLFAWARSSDWEREVENQRAETAALIAGMAGNASLNFLKKKKKSSRKRKALDDDPTQQGPPRRSRRLHQDDTDVVPIDTPATDVPSTDIPSVDAPRRSMSALGAATSLTTVPETAAPGATSTTTPSMTTSTTTPDMTAAADPTATTPNDPTTTSTTTAPTASTTATTPTASTTATAATTSTTAIGQTTSMTATPPTASTTATAPTALTPRLGTTTVSVLSAATASGTTSMIPSPSTDAVTTTSSTATPETTASSLLMPAVSTVVPAVAVDMSGWPVWLKEGFKRLDMEEYGEDFQRAVGWWTVFERRHNWATTVKGLPTNGRPEEVAEWLRFGRKLGKNPAIADEEAYAQRWCAWWASLQPDWRRDAAGKCVRAGEGPWGILDHPGKNGVFIALLSLMWWKEAATSTTEKCQEAVLDISWVIWKVASSGMGSQKRPAEPPAEPKKVKKARR